MADFEKRLDHNGRDVVDAAGVTVGSIEAIYVEAATSAPQWALVSLAAPDRGSTLIPITGVASPDESLQVPYSMETVFGAPEGSGAELHTYYMEISSGTARIDPIPAGPPPDWP